MNSSRPIVVALGGNALSDDNAGQNYPGLAAACRAMADAAGQGLIVTHGNGPQIGERAMAESRKDFRSLDRLGAETEGLLGYRIEQELARHLPAPENIATLLTQVEVDPDDPAFAKPSKPVGPWLDEDEATRLGSDRGWQFQAGEAGYRRLVASPMPRRIVQLKAIRTLLAAGIHVICAGGGGIPVIRGKDATLEGIEAVVDKDHASALLAVQVEARLLVLATNVDGVYRDWNNGKREKIHHGSPAELETLSLPAGSMGPKVAAACEFAKTSGQPAVIGSIAELGALLKDEAGTRVYPDTKP